MFLDVLNDLPIYVVLPIYECLNPITYMMQEHLTHKKNCKSACFYRLVCVGQLSNEFVQHDQSWTPILDDL